MNKNRILNDLENGSLNNLLLEKYVLQQYVKALMYDDLL